MARVTDYIKKQLHGHTVDALKKQIKSSIATAKVMGSSNVKDVAVESTILALGIAKGATELPARSLVEHYVMEAMAGTQLTLDGLNADTEKGETK